MPVKKRVYRRRPRRLRRRYKKKVMRRSANKSFWGNISLDKTPLPKRFKATLRYLETGVSINNTAGGLGDAYVFSANGIFDPNISGVGHQPVGFDQLMSMFNHYTVIASKIRVNFANSDGSAHQTVGIFLKENVTEQPDIRIMVENGGCKYMTLAPKSGNSKDSCTLTAQVAPHKWLGKKNPLDDSDLRGSASSNPNEQCYWHVFCNDFGQSADAGAVVIQVQIDYVVVFSEPKELALS